MPVTETGEEGTDMDVLDDVLVLSMDASIINVVTALPFMDMSEDVKWVVKVEVM